MNSEFTYSTLFVYATYVYLPIKELLENFKFNRHEYIAAYGQMMFHIKLSPSDIYIHFFKVLIIFFNNVTSK